ncbi:hypothetical protein K488DRAFT_47639 [Vararia minispora EC-137]|uniref:Uncharacterized protein n=1 Tax=Vararia minispora EC-137 TaxID=1314806 RepID=A0ACB8QP57_9AGAM|nr:hypothetical protein K488DRAFT_47639 [Vararia minispora EC-137]
MRVAWVKYARASTAPPDAATLTFVRVVWPVLVQPMEPAGLTADAIEHFLLSNPFTPSEPALERVRRALTRWHEDKWHVVLDGMLSEGERVRVREGVNTVTRCLLALKTKYKSEGTGF